MPLTTRNGQQRSEAAARKVEEGPNSARPTSSGAPSRFVESSFPAPPTVKRGETPRLPGRRPPRKATAGARDDQSMSAEPHLPGQPTQLHEPQLARQEQDEPEKGCESNVEQGERHQPKQQGRLGQPNQQEKQQQQQQQQEKPGHLQHQDSIRKMPQQQQQQQQQQQREGQQQQSLHVDDPNEVKEEYNSEGLQHKLLSPDEHSTCCGNSTDVTRSQSNSASATPAVVRSPSQVLQEFGTYLTEFERNEILRFREIWWFGVGADKIQGITEAPTAACSRSFDNTKGDYHIVVDDHLHYRYRIMQLLGRGAFGQVVKALDCKSGARVAVKVVRNKAFSQSDPLAEAKLLDHIRCADPEDRSHVVHMVDYFEFRGHACVAFELLSIDLAHVLKQTAPHGLLPKLTHRFACQILKALAFLKRLRIIHRDLKPDNVMLKDSWGSCLKVVDFGSSCYEKESQHHSTYVQSRFYRAPEVILGVPYGGCIDMWSFGCMLAEFCMNKVLFAGWNEVDQLQRVMEVLGVPPEAVLERAARRRMFFHWSGEPRVLIGGKSKPKPPATRDLASLLYADNHLVNFVRSCLDMDSTTRATPQEALNHEWIKRRPATTPSDAATLATSATKDEGNWGIPAVAATAPRIGRSACPEGEAQPNRTDGPSRLTTLPPVQTAR